MKKWLDSLLKDIDSEFGFASNVEGYLKTIKIAKENDRPIVLLMPNPYLAQKAYDFIAPLYEEDVVTYLPEESLRAAAIASSFESQQASILALEKIINNKAKISVVSPFSLLRFLPSKEELKEKTLHLDLNSKIERDDLISLLNSWGYQRQDRVERSLTYASRGCILDVYSLNYENPIRIEFYDDEIDSLRFFDLASQETIKQVKEVDIIFASDIYFNIQDKETIKKKLANISPIIDSDIEDIENSNYSPRLYAYMAYGEKHQLLEYYDNPLLLISDELAIENHLSFLQEESFSYLNECIENQSLPNNFTVYGDYSRTVKPYKKLIATNTLSYESEIVDLELPYTSLEDSLKIIAKEDKKSLLVLDKQRLKEIVKLLEYNNITYNEYKDELKIGINICEGELNQGFYLAKKDIKVYSSQELYHIRSSRFSKQFAGSIALQSYEELKKGDYVVHENYGIGQFVGIYQRENQYGALQDYLQIIYANDDYLLVPLNQFSLVRKYIAHEGSAPRLNRLGSKTWQKTKQKVEQSVDDLAKRLLDLYAEREKDSGFACSADSPLQKQFESEFVYELTDDQKKAIKEVKKDMESSKPMDRLLCGDVGFGKTEVALRASFKAVDNQKQVAYLCPTTILSMQHYKTFMQRLYNYPVQVALLNRFTSESDQKQILKRLKEGKIDILIGTHRILSNDVEFKDLGLLIIDEEQRFGVEHKEKIKQMKSNIDVLSLSATPIPRSLQLSLIGLRGLSTLDSAPDSRYPIQTYIVEKSDELIKEAVMRELQRGGQIFYLSNNIDFLYKRAQSLQKLLPLIRIKVVHGKMAKEEIEDVMLEFYHGKIDLLLTTTIIETGIDIPNANTILIEDAQNFGLSQLYQIKGRVGRSDRVAYAYLMIPKAKELTEESSKRLNAIKEFTALGSGYKIAMRDLTIRGAGDILGNRQSGFIDNVGLDLYLSLLQQAIERNRNVKRNKRVKKSLELPLSSYIPKDFTNDYDKLNIYHQLESIDSKSKLKKFAKKFKDEYGNLPSEIEMLLNKKSLELLLDNGELEKIDNRNKMFILTLSQSYSDKLDGYKLFSYCNQYGQDIKINYTGTSLVISCIAEKSCIQQVLNLCENFKDLQKDEN